MALFNESFLSFAGRMLRLVAILLFVVKPIVGYYRDPYGLRRFPAVSRWATLTNLWYMYNTSSHQRYIKLHAGRQKHPILRVGPNHLTFGRAKAIKDVLGHGVFFCKSDWYAVLAGSHRHIVDEQDRGEHGRKRKLLSAAYSAKPVAAYESVVTGKISLVLQKFDEFCSQPLKKEQAVAESDLFDFCFGVTCSPSMFSLKLVPLRS
jgi:cytochrome P450